MDKYKEEPTAPSGKSSSLGWRHVQILLLFSGMAVGYVLRACMSIAVAAMTNKTIANPDFPEYDWSPGDGTMVQSSFFWGYILTMMPSGYIGGVWSAHKLVAFSMFLSSTLHMLGPFIAEYGYQAMMVNRFFVGAFQGGLIPCVHSLLSCWVPPLERARLGSFVMNGPQFGTIIAMAMSGYLSSSALGWPSLFYLYGIIGMVWSIIFFLVAADSPSTHSRIKHKEASYINSSLGNLDKAGKVEKPKVPWKAMLMSKPVWALLIVHSGYNWGLFLLFTVLPTYMGSILGFDITKSGGLSALPYISMWLLGFPISYVADWALDKGFTVTTVRKIANTIGLWIPAVALILICIISPTNTILMVAIIAVGVGFNSGVTSGFQINHIDLSPNFAGTIMSITNTSANIAGIGAQLAFKFIVTDKTDVKQWIVIFSITAGIYFSTNMVFLLFGKCHIQTWNSPGDEYRPRPGRVSVISITGEPTSLYLPEQIDEEEDMVSPC